MRSNGTYLAYTYSYHDENQLKSVAYADGSQPATAWWRLDFVYDGRDRLRRKLQYSWNSGWAFSQEWRYIYDGNLMIQERTGAGFGPQASYARGVDMSGTLEGAGGIGGLLERATGYPSWNTHNYYQADGNGNITALEDNSQNLITGYRYDPFGNTLFAPTSGPGFANPFRFSSKQLDFLSGMYYYGYRWYDPNLQRWPNRDPIFDEGDINLYTFSRNNPVTLFDPDGRQAFPFLRILRGCLKALVPKTSIQVSAQCHLVDTRWDEGSLFCDYECTQGGWADEASTFQEYHIQLTLPLDKYKKCPDGKSVLSVFKKRYPKTY